MHLLSCVLRSLSYAYISSCFDLQSLFQTTPMLLLLFFLKLFSFLFAFAFLHQKVLKHYTDLKEAARAKMESLSAAASKVTF
jgi:hypothetical protein